MHAWVMTDCRKPISIAVHLVLLAMGIISAPGAITLRTLACCVLQTFGEGSMKVKVYHHYAYRVEAAPPFRICGVSKEIQLVTRKKQDNKKAADWTHQRIWKDTSQTAYISGLFLDSGIVHISYGSSDIDARLLSMSVADMEHLFADSPWNCSKSNVIDAGSGKPLSVALQQMVAEAGSSRSGAESSDDSSSATRAVTEASDAPEAAVGPTGGWVWYVNTTIKSIGGTIETSETCCAS
eukprot:GHRR01028112.1.p1 GENE.GHRR01028112.1~~GHRR01028112.1.p1  ORF type:complete len:238 (+),score=58.86 GHRR01028112.1:847-1560(+)